MRIVHAIGNAAVCVLLRRDANSSWSTMLMRLRCIRHIKRVINACLQLRVSVVCIG